MSAWNTTGSWKTKRNKKNRTHQILDMLSIEPPKQEDFTEEEGEPRHLVAIGTRLASVLSSLSSSNLPKWDVEWNSVCVAVTGDTIKETYYMPTGKQSTCTSLQQSEKLNNCKSAKQPKKKDVRVLSRSVLVFLWLFFRQVFQTIHVFIAYRAYI